MRRQKTSFVLGGLFLAALTLGVLLLVGILTPKYDPFGANRHTTCGEPATMRAEGYNLLGGTRYGRDADDTGSDVALAQIDFCDPIVEERTGGEERLWFWLEIEVIGQVFPYYAWGLPWEDLGRINPADNRNPTDPIWSLDSIWGQPDAAHGGTTWAGHEARLCDDWDQSGLVSFFNSGNGFSIPYGTTRSGWICLTFSDETQNRPLPGAMVITTHPGRARLTRWVDAWMLIHPDEGYEGEVEAPAVVDTLDKLCAVADTLHPDSIVPGGPCELKF